MKYAMKMVLIPESEYRRLLPQGTIKNKMNKLLSGKRNRETATELTQMFGRHLRTTKPEPQPQQKPLDKLQLLDHLPVLYHAKVSKFLTEFENYGASWTDKYELVLKSGEIIANSNIKHLLKEAFVAKRRRIERDVPNGWKQFITEIVDANIPITIFTKNTTREDIKQDIEDRDKNRFPERWENF
jgi:hypothetical protein